MRHRILVITALFYIIFIGSVSGQSTMPTDISETVRSSVTVPVEITLSEIESMLNQSVTGLIYEDNSHTDNNNDLLKLKVWKKGHIKLSTNTTNQLKIAVPLRVWAEKGIGALGYVTYQATEFELILNFKTVFSIRPDWSIKTVTTPDGYTWLTKPVLKYKYVDVPITPLVANILDREHENFSKIIDKEVGKSLNFQPYALQVWNMMSPPQQLSEVYNTWLSFRPISIRMTPLQADQTAIRAKLGIDVNSTTVIGRKPDTGLTSKTVPHINLVRDLPPSFHVITMTEVDYKYATEMANQQFKNHKMSFLKGKKEITIEEVTVGQEDDNVVLTSRVSGSINGSIIIKGRPYYDSLNYRIALQDVNFHLISKNIFLKSASWLFNGTFERMIEKDYGIDMKAMMQEAHKGVTETINKVWYPGVAMYGNVSDMRPTEVLVTDHGIVIKILTAGQVWIRVQGLMWNE